MKTTLEQYSNRCRTCLNELDDKKIFLYKDGLVGTMLSQCTSLSIFTKDGLMCKNWSTLTTSRRNAKQQTNF
jgi:hypothetical protein